MSEDYTFEFRGKTHTLNGVLIERQGLDVDACHKIAEYHREKLTYLEAMFACKHTDKDRLHELYELIRDMEFLLQDAWGFPRNENWHKHWEVPHCRCPTLDNIDDYPYRSYISGNCPVHG